MCHVTDVKQPASLFDIMAFDADDTLWHTERLYVDAQARFVQLLAHYRDRSGSGSGCSRPRCATCSISATA